MKKSKFTEEQIAYAPCHSESSTPILDIYRKLGVSEQTFYRWKKKYDGMSVAELRRLRQLEEETRRLKSLVADLTLNKHMLTGGHQKKALKPAPKRALVEFLHVGIKVSTRRACRMVRLNLSTRYYCSRAKDQSALRIRLRDLAQVRVRMAIVAYTYCCSAKAVK